MSEGGGKDAEEMRKAILLFICLVTLGVSSSGYADELTFSSKCLAAISGNDFKEGRKSLANGLQSLGNMGSLMSEDPQTDRILVSLWQGVALQNSINAVLGMGALRTMVAPSKLREADELITGQLNVLFNGLRVVLERLDGSILITSKPALREELREIRRSVNQLIGSLKVCRK